MTATGWPPATDQWAWRVLLAISDQLHAYHHALTLLAQLPPDDMQPGMLARPLNAAADAAVTRHDDPWLRDLLSHHGHPDTARRWHAVTSHDPHDAISQLRQLAWLDHHHSLDPDTLTPVIAFATAAFQQAGTALADLETDLLNSLRPAQLLASPTPNRYNIAGRNNPPTN